MYHEILPPPFHSICHTCCSLDYELNAEDPANVFFIKKSKEKVKKPFPMFKVPNHILDQIFTKMHFTAFSRMRRTNMQFVEYIESRRDFLRLALFHDKTMKFVRRWESYDGREKVPFIQFSGDIFRTRSRLEAKGIKGIFGSSESPSLLGNLFASDFPTRSLSLPLHRFEEYSDVRRELAGCYFPVTISIDENYDDLDDDDWEIFLSRVENFLNWTGIQKQRIGFETSKCNPFRQWEICSMLHIQTAHFNHSRNWPFSGNTTFKETEFLFLNRCHVPTGTFELFPNLQLLSIDGDSEIHFKDFEEIIGNWVRSENSLKEIQINAEIFYSDDIWRIFEELIYNRFATLLPKKQAMAYLKGGFPNFNRMWEDKTLRSFLLEQKSSGKKAFCTVRGKHSYRSVAVKMLL